jgi:ABC-2 type transport system permease protein
MTEAWRPYGAVVSARFRAMLQYRAAAVAGFGTQLFWGVIRVAIYTAFYRSSARPQPLPLPDMISYLWLTQAMFALAMWNVDQDVRAMIRTGTVAYEMLRPLDLYGLWYCRALAARLAPTLLRAIPMFFVALFLGLRLPPSLGAFAAWATATCGAFALAAAFSALMTISLLYTVSGDGITRLAPTIMYAFSGMLLPLPLMPAWAQTIVGFLPFRDLIDSPFRLYTGNIPAAHLGMELAHQISWLLVLVVVGRLLLRRATRRLVVQGG